MWQQPWPVVPGFYPPGIRDVRQPMPVMMGTFPEEQILSLGGLSLGGRTMLGPGQHQSIPSQTMPVYPPPVGYPQPMPMYPSGQWAQPWNGNGLVNHGSFNHGHYQINRPRQPVPMPSHFKPAHFNPVLHNNGQQDMMMPHMPQTQTNLVGNGFGSAVPPLPQLLQSSFVPSPIPL